MLRRLIPSLGLLSLLLLPLASGGFIINTQGASAAPAFANSQFEQVWSRTDLPVANSQAARSWLWGPQPGEVRAETYAGVPGGTRTVQYFDKARMEVNPGADPNSEWATTTGLLVVELVSGRVQTGPNSYETHSPAQVPVAGDSVASPDKGTPLYSSFSGVASLPNAPDRRVPSATSAAVVSTIDGAGKVGTLPSSDVHYSAYSQETGHNIPDVFERFMQSAGPVSVSGTLQQGQLFDPVYVLGYPITEAYWATVPVGGKPTSVLIQLYQRRVLTYIPGYDPAWQLQMGNVGQHYFTWRYSNVQTQGQVNPAGSAAPTSTPTPGPGADDEFIHVVGNHLYYAGKPIVLKGTNYWMHVHPFVGTWTDWDGNVVKQELDNARSLGVNTLRVGIPYDHSFALTTIWGPGCTTTHPCDHVNGKIANEMTQLLQLASGYNMKVIFTLFEWSDKFPAPNTAEYQKQMNYLQGVVAPFVNDDRVLGWDLHNEPENYDTWSDHSDTVIYWLSNLAKAVHSIDTHHPLTIGMGNYQNLWLASNGQRIIDMVDFVSFHCYDAGGFRGQIDAVQAHTQKPILLEEMGWPTGPASLSKPNAVYDEATQQFLYKSMLGDAKASPLVGVFQWTLQDYPIGTDTHYIKPTVEAWFGLVRRDGSFKPAATDFRDSYPAPSLPSRTTSNLPLTKASNSDEP